MVRQSWSESQSKGDLTPGQEGSWRAKSVDPDLELISLSDEYFQRANDFKPRKGWEGRGIAYRCHHGWAVSVSNELLEPGALVDANGFRQERVHCTGLQETELGRLLGARRGGIEINHRAATSRLHWEWTIVAAFRHGVIEACRLNSWPEVV